MVLPLSELAQPASSRFIVSVVGGDAVFLVDRRLGHKIYVGLEQRLSRPELRRYVSGLNQDLRRLSVGDFLQKYELKG